MDTDEEGVTWVFMAMCLDSIIGLFSSVRQSLGSSLYSCPLAGSKSRRSSVGCGRRVSEEGGLDHGGVKKIRSMKIEIRKSDFEIRAFPERVIGELKFVVHC